MMNSWVVSWSYLCNHSYRSFVDRISCCVANTPNKNEKKKKTKQKRNKTRSRSKKTTTTHRKKRALCFHVFSLIKTLFLCFLSCMLPRLTIMLTDRIDCSKEREIKKKVLLNRLHKPGSRWFFFAFHSIFCFLFS